jgi:anti-sigma-K factor RskA
MSLENISTDARREHIEELASVYALGALTEEADLQEFENLIESGDPMLSHSLEQMLAVSASLAAAVPQFTPPAAIRASLIDAINNKTYPTETKPPRIENAKPSADAVRLKTRSRYFIGTSFVAGLLICYLVALNVSSSAKLDRSNDLMKSLLKQTDSLRAATTEANPKTENDPSQPGVQPNDNPVNKRFFSLFADPDLKLVTLASMPAGATRQHLFFSPKQKMIYFVYDNSHPMNAGKTYELWAVIGSKAPVSIGSFKIDPKKDPPVYSFPAKLKAKPDSFSISEQHDADHAIFSGNVPKE